MALPIPVIQLDVQGMRHTMDLDETFQTALEAYCTPENSERVIHGETEKILDQVIREEVKNWFVHGEGRKVIKEAVEKKLKDNETYIPQGGGQ